MIVIRPRALDDLGEIWAYRLYLPRADAERTVSLYNSASDAFAARIDRKFHALARQPGMGRARPELNKDLRSLAVGRHVIFYLPLSNGIEVVRVLHGARDIEAEFQDAEQT
jgi:toxin ParE1/3/4